MCDLFDMDGNNIINNADKQIIGDPNPDYRVVRSSAFN
jgi:hypothetical protein